MSNIVTSNPLLPCASVTLALLVAFIVVAMPKPDTAAASSPSRDANTSCLQNWPYYERSCLSDSGNARAVRIIALNGRASRRAPHQ